MKKDKLHRHLLHAYRVPLVSLAFAASIVAPNTAFAFGGHKHISLAKESFLASHSKDAADLLAESAIIGDIGSSFDISPPHFDNCHWDTSLEWMDDHMSAAVDAAIEYREGDFQDSDKQVIFDNIGYVLHAAEDFYSHSNWVENHGSHDIAKLGVESVSKPSNWYSGTWSDTESDLLCPAGTPTHGEMSKDSSSAEGHDSAVKLAKLESQFQLEQFRLRLIEKDGLDDASETLNELGLFTQKETFSSAMYYPQNDHLYFFRKENKYNKYDFDEGYKFNTYAITRYWEGLESISADIQASFVASNAKAYFFSGDSYTRYSTRRDEADTGYPRSISGNWPGLWESGIDAIFQYPGTTKIYAFKGNQYMRYDLELDKVDSGYPQDIAWSWNGLEDFATGIDAAIVSPDGDKVYFFKGEYYICYDIESDQADSGYPKKIEGNWDGF